LRSVREKAGDPAPESDSSGASSGAARFAECLRVRGASSRESDTEPSTQARLDNRVHHNRLDTAHPAAPAGGQRNKRPRYSSSSSVDPSADSDSDSDTDPDISLKAWASPESDQPKPSKRTKLPTMAQRLGLNLPRPAQPLSTPPDERLGHRVATSRPQPPPSPDSPIPKPLSWRPPLRTPGQLSGQRQAAMRARQTAGDPSLAANHDAEHRAEGASTRGRIIPASADSDWGGSRGALSPRHRGAGAVQTPKVLLSRRGQRKISLSPVLCRELAQATLDSMQRAGPGGAEAGPGGRVRAAVAAAVDTLVRRGSFRQEVSGGREARGLWVSGGGVTKNVENPQALPQHRRGTSERGRRDSQRRTGVEVSPVRSPGEGAGDELSAERLQGASPGVLGSTRGGSEGGGNSLQRLETMAGVASGGSWSGAVLRGGPPADAPGMTMNVEGQSLRPTGVPTLSRRALRQVPTRSEAVLTPEHVREGAWLQPPEQARDGVWFQPPEQARSGAWLQPPIDVDLAMLAKNHDAQATFGGTVGGAVSQPIVRGHHGGVFSVGGVGGGEARSEDGTVVQGGQAGSQIAGRPCDSERGGATDLDGFLARGRGGNSPGLAEMGEMRDVEGGREMGILQDKERSSTATHAWSALRKWRGDAREFRFGEGSDWQPSSGEDDSARKGRGTHEQRRTGGGEGQKPMSKGRKDTLSARSEVSGQVYAGERAQGRGLQVSPGDQSQGEREEGALDTTKNVNDRVTTQLWASPRRGDSGELQRGAEALRLSGGTDGRHSAEGARREEDGTEARASTIARRNMRWPPLKSPFGSEAGSSRGSELSGRSGLHGASQDLGVLLETASVPRMSDDPREVETVPVDSLGPGVRVLRGNVSGMADHSPRGGAPPSGMSLREADAWERTYHDEQVRAVLEKVGTTGGRTEPIEETPGRRVSKWARFEDPSDYLGRFHIARGSGPGSIFGTGTRRRAVYTPSTDTGSRRLGGEWRTPGPREHVSPHSAPPAGLRGASLGARAGRAVELARRTIAASHASETRTHPSPRSSQDTRHHGEDRDRTGRGSEPRAATARDQTHTITRHAN